MIFDSLNNKYFIPCSRPSSSGEGQMLINRLQRVLNTAARVTCSVPHFSHITPVLKHLHWLSVQFRIQFKIVLLVFKVCTGIAPPYQYLTELLRKKTASRYALRTNSQLLLEVPLTRCKTFGDRAFAHAAPKIWNNLPLAVRKSGTIDCFKTRLKTFLFKSAFECQSYKTLIDGNFNYLDTFKVGCLLTLYPILNFNLFQFIIIIFFINVKRFRILCNASAI